LEERRKVARDRYADLLALGRNVPLNRKEEWYDRLAWWTEAETKTGARVFVLAPRGPQGQPEAYINMWELLSFVLAKMDEVVVGKATKFAVVWVQLSDHRVWPWEAYRFSESLHERYSEHLEAIHVIHPSWTTRFLRLALWPLASEEFWDYFYSHERIEFLDTYVDFKKFRLPKDIHDYDKWLDQQASELNKQQAARTGGAFGGGMMGYGGMGGMAGQTDAERQKLETQMEEMKRLLREKGFDGKED